MKRSIVQAGAAAPAQSKKRAKTLNELDKEYQAIIAAALDDGSPLDPSGRTSANNSQESFLSSSLEGWEKDEDGFLTPPSSRKNSLDINSENKLLNEQVLILNAIKFGTVDDVKRWVDKGIDFNFKDNKKGIPIIEAAKSDKREVINLLINKEVDVNAKNADGKTALHHVRSVEMLELLIKAGADVNVIDNSGKTILHSAAENKRTNCLEFILNNTFLLNELDIEGNSALFYALKSFNIINIGIFLSKKNINIDAIHSCFDNIIYNKDFDKIISSAIECGVDINMQDKHGNNLLHKACAIGNERTIKFLISKDINIDALNELNQTPLFIAAQNEHVQAVKILLLESVSLIAKNSEGEVVLNLGEINQFDFSAKIKDLLAMAREVDLVNNDPDYNLDNLYDNVNLDQDYFSIIVVRMRDFAEKKYAHHGNDDSAEINAFTGAEMGSASCCSVAGATDNFAHPVGDVDF